MAAKDEKLQGLETKFEQFIKNSGKLKYPKKDKGKDLPSPKPEENELAAIEAAALKRLSKTNAPEKL